MKTDDQTGNAERGKNNKGPAITGSQNITPFLWFDGKVEEAINFYTAIFKNSEIISVNRLGEKIMTGTFKLNGVEFMALDGGPMFSFTPAISFFVKCETQAEVDDLWEKLSAGGEKNRCGWLRDKYGISWQIIPNALGELMYDKNPVKSKNVMEAMLKMDKIDIEGLKRAYNKD